MVFLSLILVVAFSTSKTIDNYLYNSVLKDIQYNYYFVFYSDTDDSREVAKEKLLSINHVSNALEDYENKKYVGIKKIGNVSVSGDLLLIGKDEDELVRLSKGKYKDSSSIICHKDMAFDTNLEGNKGISRNDFYSMKKYIGDKILLEGRNVENLEYFYKEVELVSVVNNDRNQYDECICYASRDLLTYMYEEEFKNYDISGEVEEIVILLDDPKNIEEAGKEITEFGYTVGSVFQLNNAFLNFIHSMKYYSLGICMIFIIIFIIKLNKSSLENNIKNYNILRKSGMKDKDYYSSLNLENIVLVIKSFIISSIIILLIDIILNVILYFYPFALAVLEIKVDFISLILYELIVSIVLYLSTIYYFKRIKKSKIEEVIGD